MHPTRTIALIRKTVPAAAPAMGALVAAAVALTSPVPSLAQDNTEARLRRAEAEIRALQRTVFPGGDGRFFEPSIASGTGTQPSTTVARPSTSAVTDILARLDAMELQLQRLTGLTEENSNAISALDTRLMALEAAGTAASDPGPDTVIGAGGEIGTATDSNLAVMTGNSDAGQDASSDAGQRAREIAEEPSGPTPERLSGVQAITKPQTEDPGDDEYSYGFRLWNAGYYPEARQQLASFVESYPDHSRLTYGRNLLGRAFLDDGMPEEAARWFLRNYQADRTARRAPDSLLFLAESMIAMDDTRRACIALAEFGETYPAVATGRLADQYQSNLQNVSCDN